MLCHKNYAGQQRWKEKENLIPTHLARVVDENLVSNERTMSSSGLLKDDDWSYFTRTAKAIHALVTQGGSYFPTDLSSHLPLLS